MDKEQWFLMAYYNKNGVELLSAYSVTGSELAAVYDIDGNIISGTQSPYIFGTAYPLSEMSYTDSKNVTSTSALHARNATTTIKYAPTVKGNVATTDSEREWVEFSCNISTNGSHAGLWIYADPSSCIVYGGKSTKNDGLIRIKIKLNTTSYSFASVKAGMNYYRLSSPPATITSISVSAINYASATNLTSYLYLDSLEVGFSANRAHVMFNLDCVPSNFMDVGYPLFEEYGLKCTLHYPISDTSSTAGADSTYLDTTIHNQLVAAGYDYAVYSGWKSYENGGDVPFYDDESKQAVFEAHAERMWKVNNDSGIYAPSCIHGTSFLWGYVYNAADRDYDFLMIRRGNASNSADCLHANYDPEFRTMTPYFIQNAWDASSTKVTDLKAVITSAVSTKQALQIGFHQIKDSSYTPSGNDIYIGVDAVEEILSYVKSFVDAGTLVCCTTAKYVQEMSPDTYATWYAQRNPS